MGIDIFLAAVVTTAGAFLLMRVRRGSSGPDSVALSAAQMFLCLIAGLIGALATSRGWAPLEITMSSVVACTLAAAANDGLRGARPSIRLALVPLVFVAVSALVEGRWPAVAAGAAATIPFVISGWLFPRQDTLADALFSAIAGLTLGLLPGVGAVLVGGFVSIVVARSRTGIYKTAYAPFLACSTLIVVLGTIALDA